MLVDDVTVADLAAALSNADLGDAIRQARALLAPAAVGEHGGVSA
jgi:ribosomal protein L12E/L44/L45/RPP1/RPP2